MVDVAVVSTHFLLFFLLGRLGRCEGGCGGVIVLSTLSVIGIGVDVGCDVGYIVGCIVGLKGCCGSCGGFRS